MSAELTSDMHELLAQLSSVKAFNSYIDGRGELLHQDTGGYVWRAGHDGPVVCEVPECDERTAVWCVLYYIFGGQNEQANKALKKLRKKLEDWSPDKEH